LVARYWWPSREPVGSDDAEIFALIAHEHPQDEKEPRTSAWQTCQGSVARSQVKRSGF